MQSATPAHPNPCPVLYSFRCCPYAMRARSALLASGIGCEIREVVLKSKPAQLLAASPKATVPVLVLPDGSVIDESLEIMHWALEQNDPQHWLAPSIETGASVQALIAINDGDFKHHLDRYKYPNRYRMEHAGTEQSFACAHRTSASEWLFTLEKRLERCPWLFGHSASLADMAIGPFIRQFSRTEANWFSVQPWPRVKMWLAQWESSGLFKEVMKKYLPWKACQPGTGMPASEP